MNNKIVKLALILFLVCAITAGVLGGVHMLTKDRIADYKTQKRADAFATVLKSESYTDIPFDKESNPRVTNISKADGGEGWVVESTFPGAQGNISMVTGVSPDYKCTGISIVSHSETSGLGANAASTAEVGVNFRNQFIGADDSVALTKSGGDIDALTGATITSRSVTEAVAAAITACENLG